MADRWRSGGDLITSTVVFARPVATGCKSASGWEDMVYFLSKVQSLDDSEVKVREVLIR